jgi:predicted amidophosphoribosyltransferase
MLCVACGEWSPSSLCEPCGRTLRPAPDAHHGVLVKSAFLHAGAALRLVHRLKYEGVPAAAAILASAMVPKLPSATRVLVPVPRSLSRRVTYGIDPGRELALAISRITGLLVVHCLRPEVWHTPNAGQRRGSRRSPRFGLRGSAPAGVVLIDDVLTTGLTLLAAKEPLGAGVVGAVTATRAFPRSQGLAAGGGILPDNGRIDRDR